MKLELDCRYRTGDFLLDVNTSIPLEGITGLFGPSGGGKTTLLRIISGLERRAAGQVSFNGENWQGESPRVFVPPHRRSIGYVFQDTRLFSHLTVRGNIAYGLKRRAGRIGFEDVVRVLDLKPLLDRNPVSLSGGEQQRVAIARSLLSQPRLLLMDEPVSALDLSRRREVLRYLQRLPGIFSVPILYVTHAVEEIAQLAGTVLVLAQGKVVRQGSITAVFGDADQSGSTDINSAGTILEGTVTSHEAEYHHTVVDVAGQSLLLPGTTQQVGSRIRLYINARDVSIALTRPEQISIRNILSARVITVRQQPNPAYVEIHLEMDGTRLLSHITRAALAELDLQPGKQVYLLIKGLSFDPGLFNEVDGDP